jgi:penicillin-binding protein 2
MTQGPALVRIRITVLLTLVISMLSVLVLRLYYLQILAGADYAAAAESNQVRFIPIEPTRGRILDRHGKVLVGNRSSNIVVIRLEDLEDRKKTVKELAQVLGLPAKEIESRLSDKRYLPYAAIPVAEDVPEETIVYLSERSAEFPGVETGQRAVRAYPGGATGAHLLGYLGEITAEQLELPRYQKPYRYRQGSLVGRSGIEYAYERELRGEDGLVQQRVNAAGEVIGEPLNATEPDPGYDVVTTIDARIQAITEESLALGIEQARGVYDREYAKRFVAPGGAAVVMDPRNGEIIAMASFPSYEPAAFVGGIPEAEFQSLLGHPANPLLDRAIQAEYPPGSTFKIVTATAALQDGLASTSGRYRCPGAVRFFNQTFRNWRSSDSGALSITQALQHSCNTIFQTLGVEFWRRFRNGEGERLQDYARAFGFDRPTGIELPFEKDGRVPDEEWVKRIHQEMPEAFPYPQWLPGFTINLSIGQGDLNTTPLQLANAYAAIANGGALIQPHVGLELRDGEKRVKTIEPKELGRLPVSAENLAAIRHGLELVPTAGTASSAFAGFPFAQVGVAGKTGTAQIQTQPPKQDFSWFAAYAPAHEPRYVVVTMVEEGGAGSQTAAPISRRILEGIFDLRISELRPGARTD